MDRSDLVSTDQTVSAAIAGDEPAFAALAERHRRELHVHCYRMLASAIACPACSTSHPGNSAATRKWQPGTAWPSGLYSATYGT